MVSGPECAQSHLLKRAQSFVARILASQLCRRECIRHYSEVKMLWLCRRRPAELRPLLHACHREFRPVFVSSTGLSVGCGVASAFLLQPTAAGAFGHYKRAFPAILPG